MNELKVKSERFKVGKIYPAKPCLTWRSRGFTLVEIIVAVTLFSLVVVISLGAVLTIFDANRRAQSARTAIDNLNLSLEDITRTVRFGSNYHCDNSGSPDDLDEPQNCPNGDNMLAITFNGEVIAYRLNSSTNALERSVDGGSYTKVTAPEMVVQYLRFYVYNSDDDGEQPYVISVVKGYVGSKPTIQSSFSIQTTMSQRALDL